MDFLGLITSAFGGGLTGLIGGAVEKVFTYKTKKLEIEQNRERFAHEVNMRKVDAEIMAQEWASRTKVAEIEGAAKVDVADAAAFAASFNEPARYSQGDLTDKQNWWMVGLDVFRGIIRPGLTLYLCTLTTVIYFKLNTDLPVEAADRIINTVLYLTTTACCWWFGSRGPKGK